jgi:hypothetical protein
MCIIIHETLPTAVIIDGYEWFEVSNFEAVSVCFKVVC